MREPTNEKVVNAVICRCETKTRSGPERCRPSSKYVKQRIRGHRPRTYVNGYLVNQVFEEANQPRENGYKGEAS